MEKEETFAEGYPSAERIQKKIDREEREYQKVQKAIREKKGDWLGKWLEKFSVEGDFWSKKKKGKTKNSDWL